MVYKHKGYNNDNLNDIAVIRLEEEVSLGPHIQIACLPNPFKAGFQAETGQEIWAMGFGHIRTDGEMSKKLQNIKLTYYDGKNDCLNVSKQYAKNWHSQICAGM